MWARAARNLRRVALLVPLLLTALALLLLPRPPPFSTSARLPSPPSTQTLAKDETHLQNSITENEIIFNEDGDEFSKRPWFISGGEQRPKRHEPHAKIFPEDSPGDDSSRDTENPIMPGAVYGAAGGKGAHSTDASSPVFFGGSDQRKHSSHAATPRPPSAT